MKTIYVDSDCKCYLAQNDGGDLAVVETDFFDSVAPAVIEGYRFVPAGELWTRKDGAAFAGEMIAPWRDSRELEAIQQEHERAKLAEYAAALAELGVTEE